MRNITTFALAAALLILTACSVPPMKEYPYPAWGFAISFRKPPAATETPASPDGATQRKLVLLLTDAGRAYDFSVTDAAANSKSDDVILSELPHSMADGVGGTLGPVTYVATGQLVGREFTIDKQGQDTARVRIFVTHGRIFAIVAQSTLGADDPEVTTFLDSFHLISS